jgi:hypothetical protein
MEEEEEEEEEKQRQTETLTKKRRAMSFVPFLPYLKSAQQAGRQQIR